MQKKLDESQACPFCTEKVAADLAKQHKAWRLYAHVLNGTNDATDFAADLIALMTVYDGMSPAQHQEAEPVSICAEPSHDTEYTCVKCKKAGTGSAACGKCQVTWEAIEGSVRACIRKEVNLFRIASESDGNLVFTRRILKQKIAEQVQDGTAVYKQFKVSIEKMMVDENEVWLQKNDAKQAKRSASDDSKSTKKQRPADGGSNASGLGGGGARGEGGAGGAGGGGGNAWGLGGGARGEGGAGGGGGNAWGLGGGARGEGGAGGGGGGGGGGSFSKSARLAWTHSQGVQPQRRVGPVLSRDFVHGCGCPDCPVKDGGTCDVEYDDNGHVLCKCTNTACNRKYGQCMYKSAVPEDAEDSDGEQIQNGPGGEDACEDCCGDEHRMCACCGELGNDREHDGPCFFNPDDIDFVEEESDGDDEFRQKRRTFYENQACECPLCPVKHSQNTCRMQLEQRPGRGGLIGRCICNEEHCNKDWPDCRVQYTTETGQRIDEPCKGCVSTSLGNQHRLCLCCGEMGTIREHDYNE